MCKIKKGPNNLISELSCDLTKEEDFIIDKILNDSYDAFFNAICDILIVDASPVLTIHDAILLGQPITAPFLKLVESNTRAVFRRVLHRIVTLEECVHPEDHEAIVACNFGPFFSCLMGVYVNPMDISKMLEDALAYMRRRKSEDDVFQMIEELFNQIVAEGKISGMIYDRVSKHNQRIISN